jgi:hypothetical protein
MQIVKRIFLNPCIWIYNILNYIGHLESQRFSETVYRPYDFSRDKKYY